MTGIGKRLTDRQAQTRALDEVVHLIEPFEDLVLSLCGDTLTCILAIEIQSFPLYVVNGPGLRPVA